MDAEIVDLKKWKASHQLPPVLAMNHALACLAIWQALWIKALFRWPS